MYSSGPGSEACEDAGIGTRVKRTNLRVVYLIGNIFFERDENGNPNWKDTFVYAKVNKL